MGIRIIGESCTVSAYLSETYVYVYIHAEKARQDVHDSESTDTTVTNKQEVSKRRERREQKRIH